MSPAHPVLESQAWRGATETLSPHGGGQDGVLPLLMILLTVLTGLVDALAYLELGHVFVANMTGNIVFIGLAIAGASGFSVSASLVALAAFISGGVFAGRIFTRVEKDRPHDVRAAATMQFVLFAAAAVVAAFAGDDPNESFRYTLIVLLAVAMGAQGAMVRHVGLADLKVNVMTMTLVGLVSESRLGDGSSQNTARREISVGALFVGAFLGAVLVLQVATVAAIALGVAILAVVWLMANRAIRRGDESKS